MSTEMFACGHPKAAPNIRLKMEGGKRRPKCGICLAEKEERRRERRALERAERSIAKADIAIVKEHALDSRMRQKPKGQVL